MNKSKKILIISFAITLFLFSLSFWPNEDSIIANYMQTHHSNNEPIRAIVPGRWDVVCYLTELMYPEGLAGEIGVDKPKFVAVGNSRRKLLVDGETGIMTINLITGEYALFLIFDANRMSIIDIERANEKNNKECIAFEGAYLHRQENDRDWLYLTLKEI